LPNKAILFTKKVGEILENFSTKKDGAIAPPFLNPIRLNQYAITLTQQQALKPK